MLILAISPAGSSRRRWSLHREEIAARNKQRTDVVLSPLLPFRTIADVATVDEQVITIVGRDFERAFARHFDIERAAEINIAGSSILLASFVDQIQLGSAANAVQLRKSRASGK